MDLLGDKNQDMTLEQALKFDEAKEAGKRSASRLLLYCHKQQMQWLAVRTSGRRNRRQGPHHLRIKILAHIAGRKGTGKNSPTRIRRAECPAFSTNCNHPLWQRSRFWAVCRRKTGAKSTKSTGREDAIFDTLCQVTSTDSAKHATLDHHVFDQTTEEWLRKRSKSQPYIRFEDEHWEVRLQPLWILPLRTTKAIICQQYVWFRLPKLLGMLYDRQETWPIHQRRHPGQP